MRRIPAAIVAALVLTGLATGCQPGGTIPGNPRPTPAPIGELHTMHVIVETAVESPTGLTPIDLPLDMYADVTIADGEHGISRRSGHPYPDRWTALTKAAAELKVTYRSGSNPTRFRVIATLYTKHLVDMKPHLRIMLRCFMYKDDQLIHVLDEGSHVWETVFVDQAQGGIVKSIGVTCQWTDRT